MNKEIIETLEIRQLSLGDDLKAVANLIYSSDNYIYPYLFENDIVVAERVLENMIRGNTIYNYKNIRVALSLGQIVAMIIYKPIPVIVDHESIIDCFVQAAVPVGARFAKVYNEYFKLLEDEPPDVYISNLAVNKMFRGVGVGKALMQSIFKDDLTYRLEVVKGNTPAVELYKKLGFEIDCEYPGFTEVPCYRMTKHSKGEKTNGRIHQL